MNQLKERYMPSNPDDVIILTVNQETFNILELIRDGRIAFQKLQAPTHQRTSVRKRRYFGRSVTPGAGPAHPFRPTMLLTTKGAKAYKPDAEEATRNYSKVWSTAVNLVDKAPQPITRSQLTAQMLKLNVCRKSSLSSHLSRALQAGIIKRAE